MKTIISLALAGVLASSLVCAGNLTEKHTDKAKVNAPLEEHMVVDVRLARVPAVEPDPSTRQ